MLQMSVLLLSNLRQRRKRRDYSRAGYSVQCRPAAGFSRS